MVRMLHTCAMCVGEGGLTTDCTGRRVVWPAAEPERQAEPVRTDIAVRLMNNANGCC